MNIREIAIDLLQVFAQTPPATEDLKISTLEIALKKIYDQGYKDGGDGEPTVMQERSSAETKEDVCELKLCESTKLVLRPGIHYLFTVDPSCPDCLKQEEAGRPPTRL